MQGFRVNLLAEFGSQFTFTKFSGILGMRDLGILKVGGHNFRKIKLQMWPMKYLPTNRRNKTIHAI